MTQHYFVKYEPEGQTICPCCGADDAIIHRLSWACSTCWNTHIVGTAYAERLRRAIPSGAVSTSPDCVPAGRKEVCHIGLELRLAGKLPAVTEGEPAYGVWTGPDDKGSWIYDGGSAYFIGTKAEAETYATDMCERVLHSKSADDRYNRRHPDYRARPYTGATPAPAEKKASVAERSNILHRAVTLFVTEPIIVDLLAQHTGASSLTKQEFYLRAWNLNPELRQRCLERAAMIEGLGMILGRDWPDPDKAT